MRIIKTMILSLLALLIIANGRAAAQEITGLWEVTKVQGADQEMTPVAKWTKINTDGTYKSGNGWLQNSAGRWTFDKSAMEFSLIEKNGIKDEYGPFAVHFTGKDSSMTWSRKEDGMNVTVTLKRIRQMPAATADKLLGLWDLTTATRENRDITSSVDPDNR